MSSGTILLIKPNKVIWLYQAKRWPKKIQRKIKTTIELSSNKIPHIYQHQQLESERIPYFSTTVRSNNRISKKQTKLLDKKELFYGYT
jgi:hypothetical protein